MRIVWSLIRIWEEAAIQKHGRFAKAVSIKIIETLKVHRPVLGCTDISINVIILMFQCQYLVDPIPLATAHMMDILVTIHAKMAARQRLHANVS